MLENNDFVDNYLVYNCLYNNDKGIASYQYS